MAFIKDLSERLAHRVQLTTDGHRPYLNAVEEAFGADIDYAMLIKLYKGGNVDETRYSRLNVSAHTKKPLAAIPITIMFQLLMSSARTSR